MQDQRKLLDLIESRGEAIRVSSPISRELEITTLMMEFHPGYLNSVKSAGSQYGNMRQKYTTGRSLLQRKAAPERLSVQSSIYW